MEIFSRTPLLAMIPAAILSVAGCGRDTRSATDSYGGTSAPAPRAVTVETGSSSSGSSEQKRAELLRRIRAADPNESTITRALLNEQNELGLVLNRQANLDDVPKLARTMLAELDRAFPGQNHTVIAYAPTIPPQVIGTARLNARTRDMSYTPSSR